MRETRRPLTVSGVVGEARYAFLYEARPRQNTDETVCLETPIGLEAIGFYYRDFHQMTDAEVTELLARAPLPN